MPVKEHLVHFIFAGLSTNYLSSWNLKLWTTGNVKAKSQENGIFIGRSNTYQLWMALHLHLHLMTTAWQNCLVSSQQTEIGKFKQPANLGSYFGPALTEASGQTLLKKRNFILKCSISTFVLRSFHIFPRFGWPSFHLSAWGPPGERRLGQLPEPQEPSLVETKPYR